MSSSTKTYKLSAIYLCGGYQERKSIEVDLTSEDYYYLRNNTTVRNRYFKERVIRCEDVLSSTIVPVHKTLAGKIIGFLD